MSTAGCSHARSHDYYIESIKAPLDENYQNQFWAHECEDYDSFALGDCSMNSKNVMGFRTDRE